jgi:drug/metabolite transporter (DMT)-like permease
MIVMKTSSHPRGRRALLAMLVLCLAYGVAMVVMTGLLADQHEGARFAVGAAAVAPLTAVAILYAGLRSHHAVIVTPRHNRLLLLALAGGAILGAGLAGALALLR